MNERARRCIYHPILPSKCWFNLANVPTIHCAVYRLLFTTNRPSYSSHPTQADPLLLVLTHDPQDKVDDNGAEQGNGQDGRAETIVKSTLPPLSYALRAPVEGDQCVGHCGHGDQGKQPSGYLTDLVAKVEQADGEAAQDDGEVQPGEESALVGEENFGLDAGG